MLIDTFLWPLVMLHTRVGWALQLPPLPLPLVGEIGLFACIYSAQTAYSIISLLMVGTELADPDGTDEHDCGIRSSVRSKQLSVRCTVMSTTESEQFCLTLLIVEISGIHCPSRKWNRGCMKSTKLGRLSGSRYGNRY